VCEICQALDGRIFTLDEMRNGAFEIGGFTYRLKPPAHPQGRCTILPTVGFDRSELASFQERLPTDDEIQ
jgi:hypothetical protein